MEGNSKRNGRRVVITGTGLISSLGHTVEETWSAILSGESGIGDFTLIEKGDHSSGGVCEVKDFDPATFIGKRDARRRDRFQQLATIAGKEAMQKSGLEITDQNRERVGIYIGTGVGGIRTLVNQEHVRLDRGTRRMSPFAIAMIMPNGAAGLMSIDYGIQGPANTICTACAAGNDAIGHAYKAIRAGELDAVLSGGAEAIITSVALGGFERTGATSPRSSKTPQPFDKNRDGLIAGEGAAILILEELESAKRRGATILGEIAGYGQTTDAFHITAPSKDGAGAARAINLALNDADLDPSEVDYVSAHGTGTQLNDLNETLALKTTLGDHAYKVSVSSTKSMTGHVMGATGAIEAVFCTLAIRDKVLPPTINYETPDPECDLDYVPNVARSADVRIALNNAFGFGGHNAVLVIKEFKG
jgi:3-oxoacyl-[acyl-carrier-protein] synthase II